MKILAIESSCDETAASVVDTTGDYPVVISNVVASQIDIHKKYGGVVPEVAARAHIENIIPTIKEALADARTNLEGIDRIAVTYGPGLIGSLIVGVETAKAIGAAKDIPIAPINHLEGHIYASFIKEEAKRDQTMPEFPLCVLLVSGGNTLLIYMKSHGGMEVVGATRDDAAGEAFDKGAKLLGLPYPGGPEISKLARYGNPENYQFPIIDLTPAPERNSEGFLENAEPSLDFSFSGLKTSLLTLVKTKKSITDQDKADICAAYEAAIVDTLIQNSLRALERYPSKTFILAGGVAANNKLREELKKHIKDKYPGVNYIIPELSYCGDNAAMIGAAGAYKKGSDGSFDFVSEPNLKIS